MSFLDPIDPHATYIAITKAAETVPTPSSSPALAPPATSPSREVRERDLDDTLDASFPASDPPPWTLGRRTHLLPHKP